jgi:hypothetical protein
MTLTCIAFAIIISESMKFKRIIILSLHLLSAVCFTKLHAQVLSEQLKKLSDAPNDLLVHQSNASEGISSYEASVKQWTTITDVNNWMKQNFHYEINRAKHLAENSSTREKTGIYSPAELYQIKKGVCIDLSRFAVETINIIDTSKHVQYLLIEFEPIMIDSSIIKKHWTAIYQDVLGYYIIADSKRPGHVAGPYQNVDDFISEYQTFRNRKILSWKILPSYEKRKKKKTLQQKQG